MHERATAGRLSACVHGGRRVARERTPDGRLWGRALPRSPPRLFRATDSDDLRARGAGFGAPPLGGRRARAGGGKGGAAPALMSPPGCAPRRTCMALLKAFGGPYTGHAHSRPAVANRQLATTAPYRTLTFRVDADPVQVARQLLRDVGLATGGQPHHGDDVRAVDIVGSLACNNKHTPHN
ncbi:Protein of unknown function [Gryllus bimaculatus]|nr:Protein of unknown function [Gryllus bimaculatus]